MLDVLLASVLLLGTPIYGLLRSDSTGQASVDKRNRYRKSMAMIAIFLLILIIDWVSCSRGLSQLGLAPPTTRSAISECVIAVSVAIIVYFALIMNGNRPKAGRPDDPTEAILPESWNELRSFVMFAIVAGFGWEVLYRGFLLFWLVPIVGVVPAVVASSIAYGLFHGCKNLTRTTGSLVSGLLFTAAYAATRSLWWLIILHIALPTVSMLAIVRIERRVVSGRSA